MSYCAVPDTVSVATRNPTPATLTLSPPAATGEVCDTTTTVVATSPGGSPISTTTTVAGPPGPAGPQGLQGPPGTTPNWDWPGLGWKGEWASGTEYKTANVEMAIDAGDFYPNSDVVKIEDRLYVCIQNHTAAEANQPRKEDYELPTDWTEYWELMVAGDTTSEEAGGLLDSLTNDLFDWLKAPWSIGDWLLAGAALAGIIWAGSQIADMMDQDGSEGGEADVRYNGSPSYTGPYTAPGVRTVVESLCEEAGITSYDASQLDNSVPCHFSLSQQTSVRNILDNLAKAFQFDMVDSSGVLKFVPHSSSVVRTLTADDMGFNSVGEVVAPFTTKRLQSVDLPRSVTLTYIAEDLDYNTFSQRSEIPTFEQGNDITLEVPFMLTHEKAKEATEHLLIGAHFERTQYFWKSSYQHIDLEPGDVINIPGAQVRIVQIEETEPGILEFIACDAGMVADPQPIVVGGVTIGYTASSFSGTGQAPQVPSAVKNYAPEIGFSAAMFIDPPVMDSNDTTPRAWAMVHGFGKEGWPGAQLFMSKDGGSSYNLIGGISQEATLGMVSAAIPAPTKGYHVWDDTTQIDVVLKTGSLVSKPDLAVLNGDNMCMIGREVIHFGTATLIAPNTYRLTHLLRGRRGTEWACSTHTTQELFALLNGAHIEVPVSENDRGAQYLFKAVTNGSDLASATGKAVQIVGENTIPWTPGRGSLSLVGGDWNISWLHRPRFNNALRDFTEISNDEDFSGFAVTIYNGTTAVRQTAVTGTSFTYTATQQTADFGSTQSSLKVGIATMSRRYGGGRELILNS